MKRRSSLARTGWRLRDYAKGGLRSAPRYGPSGWDRTATHSSARDRGCLQQVRVQSGGPATGRTVVPATRSWRPMWPARTGSITAARTTIDATNNTKAGTVGASAIANRIADMCPNCQGSTFTMLRPSTCPGVAVPLWALRTTPARRFPQVARCGPRAGHRQVRQVGHDGQQRDGDIRCRRPGPDPAQVDPSDELRDPDRAEHQREPRQHHEVVPPPGSHPGEAKIGVDVVLRPDVEERPSGRPGPTPRRPTIRVAGGAEGSRSTVDRQRVGRADASYGLASTGGGRRAGSRQCRAATRVDARHPPAISTVPRLIGRDGRGRTP